MPARTGKGKNGSSQFRRSGKLGVTADSRLITPTNPVKNDAVQSPILFFFVTQLTFIIFMCGQ
jgi:hypothetical protein